MIPCILLKHYKLKEDEVMLHFSSAVFIGLIGVITKLYISASIQLGFVGMDDIHYVVKFIPNFMVILAFFMIYLTNRGRSEGRLFQVPIFGIVLLSSFQELLYYVLVNEITIPLINPYNLVVKTDFYLSFIYLYFYFLIFKNVGGGFLKAVGILGVIGGVLRVAQSYYDFLLPFHYGMVLYYINSSFLGLFFLAAYISSISKENSIHIAR